MLEGKPALVLTTRGGGYGPGTPREGWDHNTAYLRRIVPLVVADACADAPERHAATLRMYNHLCFQTVTTAQAQGNYEDTLSLAEQFVD